MRLVHVDGGGEALVDVDDEARRGRVDAGGAEPAEEGQGADGRAQQQRRRDGGHQRRVVVGIRRRRKAVVLLRLNRTFDGAADDAYVLAI